MVKKSTNALQLLSSEANTPLEAMVARTLPQSQEAEQALLGALLHNNLVYERVSEFLSDQHFATAIHGKIYKALGTLINRGQVADPITLRDYFEKDDALQDVGGGQYLAELATNVVSIINSEDYARKIHDLYLRRQLIDIGEGVVNEAHTFALESTASHQIEIAEKRLFDLATSGHNERGIQPFSIALQEAIQSAEVAYKRDSHIVGVTSGLVDIDKRLGGLHPSDLIIIAGRPSMGKTALATNIAFNAAKAQLQKKEGAQVAFFSLEMSAEQLANRLLGQESKISSDRIRRGEISQNDFPKFVEISRELSQLPLFIDDTPALSVPAIRARARRLQRQEGLGLIVIDYLQLIGNPGGKNNENRVQELSEITRGLKALAKELHIPVIALSQLSRAVETRDDKRPQLSDLRESGSIEQDADVVMFVYREEYYESRKEPTPGTDKHREWEARMGQIHNLAELIIAKQRHGPVGTVKLHFEGVLTKFSNYIEQAYIPHGRT